jgi:coenzyme F420-dependent glucose-6-phosphate dehydrogenase
MVEVGYKLSSEEFGPQDLVEYAVRAERAGFAFALISDHFHPWTDRQGQSPFVWGVLGAIARATTRLCVGTAVTCPTIRIHPAIVAQAAATAAALMPGRFILGVGTGENLNEHIVGRGWPSADVRLEMLEEAIEVLRLLWGGGTKTHRGHHYTVEDARLYTVPKEPPQLMVAASKPRAAEVAGRLGDAMINTQAERSLIERFHAAGGAGKPCHVELTVCWAASERQARKTAHEIWALAALEGPLFTELALPAHFEAAFKPITEKQVAEAVICGPDPQKHVDAIRKAARAGYTHVCVHQVGPEQEAFLDFYEQKVLPRFRVRSGQPPPVAKDTRGGRKRMASAVAARRGS